MVSKKFQFFAIIALCVLMLGFVSCKEPEHEHIWTEVKSSAALKTPGNDTTKAVYWKTCSICGAISDTETFEGLFMPAAPVISVAGGSFDAEQSVELSSGVAGAKIYYTLDGSDPTSSSTLYEGPITIGADSVLKAVVIVDSEDYDPSAVASAEYKFSWGVYNKTTKKGYASLKDAFAEIANGDELVVNKDGQLDLGTADTTKVSFVLDLNGHTLTSGAINASGGPAALKFRGTAAAPIDSIVIKNGTITGGVNGNQSSALVYFNYVTDVKLINLNLINEANGTANPMSNALYNAYSTITIDNTEDNEILGRVISYMNDTVDAKFRTTYIINGGVFNADGTTGATDKDTTSILVSDSKGSSLVIVNDGIINGQFTMATDAPQLKSSIVLNAGTFAYNIELPGETGPTKIADFVPATSKVEQKNGKYVVINTTPHTHTFTDPEYSWSVDFKCTATRHCTGIGCGETETETVVGVYALTPATCVAVGKETYTATFTNTAFAQQVKEVEVAKVDHTYGTPTYEWSLDNKCTATRSCTVEGCTASETETVNGVYAVVTPPTTTSVGAATWTATFTNTAFEQQVKDVEIPMITHNFGTATYEWALDNSTCTATHSCTDVGCEEVETETVDAAYAVVTPASCTAVGAATYTATFTKTGFEQQVKNIELAIIDHTFDQEVVDDDYLVSSGATGLVYKKSCVCGLASDSETFTVVAINKTKGTHYETLRAALSAVSDGDEVILYADQTMATIQLKVGITLDLNGHTVTADGTIATNTGLIGFNAGTTGSGASKRYVHISKVVIKNGTMKGTTSNNMTNGMLRFAVVDDAVIENVNLIASATSAVCSNTIWSGYTNLTINNTSANNFVGSIFVYTNGGEVTNYGAQNSTLTINGGNFSSDPVSNKPWAIAVNEAASPNFGNSSLFFNDGAVVGGTIVKTINGAVDAGSHGTVVVKLGTFGQDVTDFLAEGYEVEETVAGKTWVAKKHVHVFDQEVAEAQYLKEGNEYYRSCRCGLASDSETFICNGTATAPAFSIASGTFNTFQSVTITSADGANIYYTTDGTDPTPTSTLYEGPVKLGDDTVLKAICAGNGYLPSSVASIDVKYETATNVTKSKSYSTLAKALAEVASGDEVTVSDDQTLAPTKLTVGITLDLNGHTVSCSTALGSDSGIINIQGSAASHIASAVIKNGSFIGKTGNNMSSGLVRFIHVDSAELSNVNITSTVEAVSKSNAIYAGYAGLVINNTDANTITGEIIIYTNGTVATGKPAVVTVNGGKFSNDTTATGTGSTWTFAINEAAGGGVSTLIFNGGTLVSGSVVKLVNGAVSDASHGVFEVYAGTFCEDVTAAVQAGSSIVKVGDNWVVTKD